MKLPSRVRLYHLSRDTGFLWKIVIGILAVSAVIGSIVAGMGRDSVQPLPGAGLESRSPSQPVNSVEQFIQSAPLPAVLYLLSSLPEKDDEEESLALEPNIAGAIGASNLTEKEKTLALAVWESFTANAPTPTLESLAAERPVFRYANEFLGRLLRERDLDRAVACYELEGRTFEKASGARAEAVKLLVDNGRYSDALRLLDDPLFAKSVDVVTAMKIAVEQKQWAKLPLILLQGEWREHSVAAVLMVALSGLVWFALALHMAQASLPSCRLLICFIAVVLGYFSCFGVLLAGFFKEDLQNFKEAGNFAGDLVFYIVGVGVPEETIKLLFFLPLVPWVVRRGDALEMLMAAGCTGLGFGIGENLNYVEGYGVSTALTRFLTANFMHLALTGTLGFALCQVVYYKRGVEKLLTMFIVVILIHGLYDALWGLREGAFFAIAVLIGGAHLFFSELRESRPVKREPISLLATFAVGSALVIGLAIVLASYQLGFPKGLTTAGTGALAFAVLNVLFVRELGTL